MQAKKINLATLKLNTGCRKISIAYYENKHVNQNNNFRELLEKGAMNNVLVIWKNFKVIPNFQLGNYQTINLQNHNLEK